MDAPAFLHRTDAAETPWAAVLAATAFGFLTVVANYLVPDRVFGFLLGASGDIALSIYQAIAIFRLRMRKALEAAAQQGGVADVVLSQTYLVGHPDHPCKSCWDDATEVKPALGKLSPPCWHGGAERSLAQQLQTITSACRDASARIATYV